MGDPLIRYTELRPLLDRVAQGTCTEADILLLRDLVRQGALGTLRKTAGAKRRGKVSSTPTEAHLGKYSITTREEGDIRIGPRVYKGPDSAAIRGLVREVLSEMSGEIPTIPGPARDPEVTAMRLRTYSLLCGSSFSLEDLEDLAFRLGVHWDDLAGDNRPKKARALISYFEHCGELPRLCEVIAQLRPELRKSLGLT